jgi:hypothetical protein
MSVSIRLSSKTSFMKRVSFWDGEQKRPLLVHVEGHVMWWKKLTPIKRPPFEQLYQLSLTTTTASIYELFCLTGLLCKLGCFRQKLFCVKRNKHTVFLGMVHLFHQLNHELAPLISHLSQISLVILNQYSYKLLV